MAGFQRCENQWFQYTWLPSLRTGSMRRQSIIDLGSYGVTEEEIDAPPANIFLSQAPLLLPPVFYLTSCGFTIFYLSS
jgi:hypothetical protein